jgi:Domain of unknown function (DUF3883)
MAVATGAYSDFLIAEIRKTHSAAKVQLEKLRGNRLRVVFKRNGLEMKFRLLMWAVSEASRDDPLERRVEITSTYMAGGLQPDPGYTDIVLGVLRDRELLVGLDTRRLHAGGHSQNASTFVYLSNFEQLCTLNHLVVLARQVLHTQEYQVYLRPVFLLDYLADHGVLHLRGIRQTPPSSTPGDVVDELDSFSARGSSRKLTYEQQVELALRKMQIGQAGESFVVSQERVRLRNANKANLASRVDWISQTKPYLGYDIASFGLDAMAEYIEVKASVNKLSRFYFTANEMKQAAKYKDRYRLICVSNVLSKPTSHEYINPLAYIESGALEVLNETSLVLVK